MMIARRTRYVLVFASTGLVAVLPALATPAVATPAYAAATGQPCETCHVNPAGGGPRTPLGMRFEALANHSTDPAAAFASLSAAAPAPAQVPTGLPRTGDAAVPSGWPFVLLGGGLLLAGALLRRLSRQFLIRADGIRSAIR